MEDRVTRPAMDVRAAWDALMARPGSVEVALGAAAVVALLSVVVTSAVLVAMPEDYFEGHKAPPFMPGRPLWLRAIATVLKNLVAWVLIALGLVMTVPGVPGQGLLTILIGLMLMDFPGKRDVEKRLFRRRGVHRVANAVRARFKRPPLRGLD